MIESPSPSAWNSPSRYKRQTRYANLGPPFAGFTGLTHLKFLHSISQGPRWQMDSMEKMAKTFFLDVLRDIRIYKAFDSDDIQVLATVLTHKMIIYDVSCTRILRMAGHMIFNFACKSTNRGAIFSASDSHLSRGSSGWVQSFFGVNPPPGPGAQGLGLFHEPQKDHP